MEPVRGIMGSASYGMSKQRRNEKHWTQFPVFESFKSLYAKYVGRPHYNVLNSLVKSMKINFLMHKQCRNVTRSLQVQNDCLFFTPQWLQKIVILLNN
jgi:hypothetical protein